MTLTSWIIDRGLACGREANAVAAGSSLQVATGSSIVTVSERLMRYSCGAMAMCARLRSLLGPLPGGCRS
jgi:hypothetical protein